MARASDISLMLYLDCSRPAFLHRAASTRDIVAMDSKRRRVLTLAPEGDSDGHDPQAGASRSLTLAPEVDEPDPQPRAALELALEGSSEDGQDPLPVLAAGGSLALAAEEDSDSVGADEEEAPGRPGGVTLLCDVEDSDSEPSAERPGGAVPANFTSSGDGLLDTFSWPLHLWRALMAVFGVDRVIRQIGGCKKVSSFFAGVGTVDIALRMMEAWSRHTMPGPVPMQTKTAFCCDSSRECQTALRRVCPHACVFGDILGFVEVDKKKVLGKRRLEFERVERLIAKAKVRPRAECKAHPGNLCALEAVDIDVSGSPCTPWSSANRKRQRFGHPDAALILLWARIIRHCRPAVLLHENVRHFPLDLLETRGYEEGGVKICGRMPKMGGNGIEATLDPVMLILVRRRVDR